MLLSFRFANHKSFRDEQQLNLTPVYDSPGGPGEESQLEAVPVAGIFGANAAGKSNVIGALDYFRKMVGQSDRRSEPGRPIPRQPFRLDPDIAREPSSYAADLLIGGTRHSYGFRIDNDGVIEEWLYTYPQHRRRKVFTRERQDFEWGEESKRSSIKRLAEIMAPTALFISVAARFDVNRPADSALDNTSAALHATYTQLWRRIALAHPADSLNYASLTRRYAYWSDAPDRLGSIVELLRAADVGLQNVLATPREEHPDTLFDYSNPNESHRRELQLQFLHQGAVGDIKFGIRDESSGTLRLLDLADRAIPVLERGGILLVDEIDSSLHPLLTASLIRLFQSPAATRRGAQLIFTSHDATLLGSIDGEDILRRDQVWFTEKGDDGASELFALAEFKPRRQGENRQKRYLNGTYGAIPELSMRLFEQAVASRMDTSAEEA